MMITCPACDGDGSLMYQWARERMVATGGTTHRTEDGSIYYRTGEGKEICFKTIGGDCQVCNGTGTVPGT